MDSVPASPDVMVIDKEGNAPESHSPRTGSPSAANYDPTQDMLDDRLRAEQKAQEPTMSAASYDETNPKLLSTLPAEKAKPVKKKKEFDMFALSDEDEDGSGGEEEDDGTEQGGQKKGTVLDAKLLDNWDDPEGYYKIISNELVNGHYRMIKLLGRGVFANVAQAEDVRDIEERKDKQGRLVAIKIVRKNDAMKKSSQKEMEFVRRLNEADPQDKKHIIQLLGSFDHKGHLCIVFEHMSKNLRDLLKEDTSGRGLSLQAVKTYARQMFIGLKHMQDCQIIHADLKPDNILVSTDKKTIKIADFGTAADKRDNEEPTPYMVSRFYRAPEIVLGMEIGYAIDMWAIGCTIFELWTGKILFNGRSNNQMIKVMMESLGWPSEKYLKKGLLSGDYFEAGPPLKFISKEQDQFQNVGFPIPNHDRSITLLATPSQN
jgi:serine/threonine-protein kinase PRP4